MEIPWVQILVAALTSSAFTTGALGGLAFLGRSIILRWLSRDLEKYKAELQATNDRELERLRTDLKLATFEHETRFAELHKERAKVIAELYGRLVQTQYSLDSLAKEKEIPIFEPEKVEEKEKIALKSLREFWKYFDDHRLCFTEGLCGTIEKFHSQSVETLFQLLATDWSYDQRMKSVLDRLAKQVPSLRREIEKEFRKVLGVEQTTNRVQ